MGAEQQIQLQYHRIFSSPAVQRSDAALDSLRLRIRITFVCHERHAARTQKRNNARYRASRFIICRGSIDRYLLLCHATLFNPPVAVVERSSSRIEVDWNIYRCCVLLFCFLLRYRYRDLPEIVRCYLRIPRQFNYNMKLCDKHVVKSMKDGPSVPIIYSQK